MGRVIMSGIVPLLKAPSTGILASALPVGTVVKLMEGGTAVEYLVVNQGIPSNSNLYDSSCDGTWLLRKDCLEARPWGYSSTNNKYAESSIAKYLNAEFFNSLGSIEQSAIKTVKIPYCVGGASSTIESGNAGFSCHAFLLSGYEVGFTTSTGSNYPVDGSKLEYFTYDAASDTRIGYTSGTAVSWYLRSPATNRSNIIFTVNAYGGNGNSAPDKNRNVRPALILPSNALFDETTKLLKGVK